jgi:hypothetical protein
LTRPAVDTHLAPRISVASAPTVEGVLAPPASKLVVLTATEDQVIAAPPLDLIPLWGSDEAIIAAGAGELDCPSACG